MFKRIRAKKPHWRLDKDQISISVNGHHIYLGDNAKNYVSLNNIEYVNFYFDSQNKKILLKPSKFGDFKTIISHEERETPQVCFSIPHSHLEILKPYSGRHFCTITDKGIEINLTS